ncbi:MAG: thiamine ABC transporter substrate-binding protein [Acidobacteria bacterium]|nr:thiamine ABC transporter substrate-binding protein [Acidobacteriota bacterium]
MKKQTLVTTILAFMLVTAACTGGASNVTSPTSGVDSDTSSVPVASRVVVMTHESFAISDETLAAFTDQTGITVELLPSGDAGTMVSQAVLTKDNPLADVIYGFDTTFLSRVLEEGILVAYTSANAGALDPNLFLDESGRATPVDFSDVCLNFDRAAFASTPPPTSLNDLTDPSFMAMTVVQNPTTSSPGLAFLLATIEIFGEEGDYTWKDFWADLVTNDVLIVAGWQEAYWGEFSGASDGTRPIVVSYASSPAAEVIFASDPITEAPTAVIADGCFRQIEFVGVINGAAHPAAAEAFVDFMTDVLFQEDIPLNMFVFPANTLATLPAEFVEFATLPDNPVTMDQDRIAKNRARWLDEWLEIVR